MHLITTSNFQRFLCNVTGHKFRLTKKITNNIKHYQCVNCGCQVSTNSKGELVPLTKALKEAHSSLHLIITKRNTRKQQKQANF